MEGRLYNGLMLVALVAVTMIHGSSAQTTHVVGDSMGWIIPPGGEVAYRTWAAGKTFRVGDTLEFNFPTNAHDVAEMSKASFDSCNSANPISMTTTGPARINLTSVGEHHFICTISQHCALGQKLTINVSGASVAPAPQPTTPPPASTPRPSTRPPIAAPQPSTPSPVPTTAPTPARAPMTYTVGDNLGWIVPPGGPAAYQTWVQGKSFAVGDTLVFNFPTGRHDVLEVTRAEFESCNVSSTTTTPITNGPARVPITSAGNHYYICTIPQHCSFGQKLAIRATTGDSASAPSPTSDGPASQPTTPSTPSTPSPTATPPSPNNSNPFTAMTSLSLTLLVAALAFLYN